MHLKRKGVRAEAEKALAEELRVAAAADEAQQEELVLGAAVREERADVDRAERAQPCRPRHKMASSFPMQHPVDFEKNIA